MNSFPRGSYRNRKQPQRIPLSGGLPPRIELMDMGGFVLQPVIEITPQALEDMFTLVDLAEGEIGWLGHVSTPEHGVFRIEEIFLPWQDVHASTAIFPTEGQNRLLMDLKANGRDLKKLRLLFWGHSHVWMDCDPSDQDDRQMQHFKKFKMDWMIRGILNKRRELRFWIWDYKNDLIYHDVPVTIAVPDSARRDMWKQKYDDRVTEISRSTFGNWIGGRRGREEKPEVLETSDSAPETASSPVLQQDTPSAPEKVEPKPEDAGIDAEVPVLNSSRSINPEKKKEVKGVQLDRKEPSENAPKRKRWWSWFLL